MKKNISVLLIVIFTLSCFGIMASATENGACGENLTWTLDKGTLTISGTGDMNNYDARHAPWYDAAPSIKSAIIEDGVSSIGSSAFYFCKKLASITIGSSVTSIGNGAFFDCIGLTSVTIPNSVTNIGACAFYGCTSLESITIPDSVTSIDSHAFFDCTSLEDVYYAGSNQNDITIGTDNECLENAIWHYETQSGFFDNIISKISSFFTTIGSKISSIFASIVEFFKNLF